MIQNYPQFWRSAGPTWPQVHDQQCFRLLPTETGLGSCVSKNSELTKSFWFWTAFDIRCMCGRGPGALQRGASSLFCPTWSFHTFDTDTSMVHHLLLVLSSTPATYSGLKLRFGSKLWCNSFPRPLIMVNLSNVKTPINFEKHLFAQVLFVQGDKTSLAWYLV